MNYQLSEKFCDLKGKNYKSSGKGDLYELFGADLTCSVSMYSRALSRWQTDEWDRLNSES